MDIEDILDELEEAADELGLVAPDFGTSKGKAYEVWVMLEIVVRLMRKGVDVFPHDCDDAFEPYFRVSGSPANMPAKDSDGHDPCHFKLHKNDNWLELHLGLNNEGLSTATHEIDLTIIPWPHGYLLRQSGGGPFKGPLYVGLELKAYSSEHKLPHDIPRALLGVALDLDPAWAIDRWTMHTVGGGTRTMQRKSRSHLAILTATELHTSSDVLLTHHGAGSHGRVMPGYNEAALDDVVDRIESLLG